MVNLVIESVGAEQTGVATGVNILMRTVGGAIGTQVAASVLAATLTAGGAQTHRGFAIAFAIGAVDARPSRRSRPSPRRVHGAGGARPAALPGDPGAVAPTTAPSPGALRSRLP